MLRETSITMPKATNRFCRGLAFRDPVLMLGSEEAEGLGAVLPPAGRAGFGDTESLDSERAMSTAPLLPGNEDGGTSPRNRRLRMCRGDGESAAARRTVSVTSSLLSCVQMEHGHAQLLHPRSEGPHLGRRRPSQPHRQRHGLSVWRQAAKSPLKGGPGAPSAPGPPFMHRLAAVGIERVVLCARSVGYVDVVVLARAK